MADFSINIELDDIIWNLSDSDKQEIIDELYDVGYVPSQLEKNEQESTNVLDELWFEAVDKISHGRLQLTSEQEEVIMSIAKSL
jgi:ArsR family metal-binding transcriptional regulator